MTNDYTPSPVVPDDILDYTVDEAYERGFHAGRASVEAENADYRKRLADAGVREMQQAVTLAATREEVAQCIYNTLVGEPAYQWLRVDDVTPLTDALFAPDGPLRDIADVRAEALDACLNARRVDEDGSENRATR